MDIERKREIARNYYHRHKILKGKTLKKVVCSICGAEFETDTNKRYCSAKCKKQARKNTIKKYEETHKEQIKLYQLKNKDKINDQKREIYKKNGGLKSKIYREENKEQINARIKECELKTGDVIITRWENLTGKKAELIND